MENTSLEIQTMIKVEICKHFAKRCDYVFGCDNILFRIEECTGHYKIWVGKRDYKFCSDIADAMNELDLIFNKGQQDDTSNNP